MSLNINCNIQVVSKNCATFVWLLSLEEAYVILSLS